MIKITVQTNFTSVKIYFNDILHLCFDRSKLVGLQSWVEGKDVYRYRIEYTFDDNVILTEYDDKEKFNTILKEMDKLF